MTTITVRSPSVASDRQLVVRRTDINFRNVDRDLVQIDVTVRNRSNDWSPATKMRLQSAPLGAFVPWSYLTELVVPSIGPGALTQVSTQVPLGRSQPLGDFSSVPPGTLLKAIAAGDDLPRARTRARRGSSARPRPLPSRREQGQTGSLAADASQMLGRQGQHWAGNINVFIGSKPVERHMAQALRIYPGKTNLAMFFVGDRRGRDEYMFELTGSGRSWNPLLVHRTDLRSLVRGNLATANAVALGKWTSLERMRVLMLAVVPPSSCDEGSLNVHVRQRSTNQEAIVEFNMNPSAAGPGCYTF